MNPILQKIESNDGATSEIRIFENQNHSRTIVIYPAMGVPSDKYDLFALELYSIGFNVVTTEMRGIGSSSERASRKNDYGYTTLANIDFATTTRWVQEHMSKQKFYVCGHSLGGQMACLMLAKNKDISVNGLILTASCSIYHRGWKFPSNLGLLAFTNISALISAIIGHFPGRKLGFGGREAKTVMRDWARNSRTGKYTLQGDSFDYESAFASLNIPILALNYHDDRFAPPKATEHLLNKMKNSNAEQIVLNKNELGAPTADHFIWMKYSSAVAREISDWEKGIEPSAG